MYPISLDKPWGTVYLAEFMTALGISELTEFSITVSVVQGYCLRWRGAPDSHEPGHRVPCEGLCLCHVVPQQITAPALSQITPPRSFEYGTDPCEYLLYRRLGGIHIPGDEQRGCRWSQSHEATHHVVPFLQWRTNDGE